MLDPHPVNRLEHDGPLEAAHHVLAELLLALVVHLARVLDQAVYNLVRVELVDLVFVCEDLPDREDVCELPLEPLDVPVLRSPGQVLPGDGGQLPLDIAGDCLAQPLAVQDLLSEPVDDVPLCVDHVVVVDQRLPYLEVLAFDLALGALDSP